MGAVQHLHDGDRVIFGHKNGYKVKVGETALQPDSEFQFVVSSSFMKRLFVYRYWVFSCCVSVHVF